MSVVGEAAFAWYIVLNILTAPTIATCFEEREVCHYETAADCKWDIKKRLTPLEQQLAVCVWTKEAKSGTE